MKLTYLATTVAVLALGASSQAVNIATWTFETNTPADLTDSATITGIAADSGSGTASGVHASAATDWSTPAGNGSANSLSANTWANGDYFQFTFSTVGMENTTIAWDQTRSGTGPSDFKLEVSTDGTNFTSVVSNYFAVVNAAPNPTWNTTTSSSIYSFSATSLGAATNNAATVWVRMTMTGVSQSTNPGPGGTNRVDNIIVNADAVPEPATMAILGLAAAAFARRKRK